jgi:hypothetical protein
MEVNVVIDLVFVQRMEVNVVIDLVFVQRMEVSVVIDLVFVQHTNYRNTGPSKRNASRNVSGLYA